MVRRTSAKTRAHCLTTRGVPQSAREISGGDSATLVTEQRSLCSLKYRGHTCCICATRCSDGQTSAYLLGRRLPSSARRLRKSPEGFPKLEWLSTCEEH